MPKKTRQKKTIESFRDSTKRGKNLVARGYRLGEKFARTILRLDLDLFMAHSSGAARSGACRHMVRAGGKADSRFSASPISKRDFNQIGVRIFVPSGAPRKSSDTDKFRAELGSEPISCRHDIRGRCRHRRNAIVKGRRRTGPGRGFASADFRPTAATAA